MVHGYMLYAVLEEVAVKYLTKKLKFTLDYGLMTFLF
jgi:hypothetical protein